MLFLKSPESLVPQEHPIRAVKALIASHRGNNDRAPATSPLSKANFSTAC